MHLGISKAFGASRWQACGGARLDNTLGQEASLTMRSWYTEIIMYYIHHTEISF